VLTFSDEVKLAKPSNQIFEMTLTELGVTPGQSIHIGDHVKNDVVGAKQIGMKTIWIEGFYEREDVNDPASQPDATVSRLGHVVPAVLELLRACV
jgi:FMN phosphatase YigB (HAD superfamily)